MPLRLRWNESVQRTRSETYFRIRDKERTHGTHPNLPEFPFVLAVAHVPVWRHKYKSPELQSLESNWRESNCCPLSTVQYIVQNGQRLRDNLSIVWFKSRLGICRVEHPNHIHLRIAWTTKQHRDVHFAGQSNHTDRMGNTRCRCHHSH